MRFRRKSRIVLWLSALVFGSFYGPLRPETEHDRRAHLAERSFVRSLIAGATREAEVPAMAIVTLNSRALEVSEIGGTKLVGGTQAARLDHLFHIGSGAKSMLAFVAGRMVERAAIDWDTRFFDVFPGLRAGAHPAYAAITLEQLLSFRAGIAAYGDWNALYDLSTRSEPSRMGFIRHVLSQPPAARFVDGEFDVLYSNASYTCAAAMLEAIAGRRWKFLLRSVLTDDLGLDVAIGWPLSRGPDQPAGHARSDQGIYHLWLRTRRGAEVAPDGSELRAFAADDPYALPDQIAPAGDVSMTPLDYARYVQLHLAGLRGEAVDPGVDILRRIHFGHEGLSLGVAGYELAGQAVSSFEGSAGTFYSHATLVPEANFAFVILCNSGSPAAVEAVQRSAAKILKRRLGLWWYFWI